MVINQKIVKDAVVLRGRCPVFKSASFTITLNKSGVAQVLIVMVKSRNDYWGLNADVISSINKAVEQSGRKLLRNGWFDENLFASLQEANDNKLVLKKFRCTNPDWLGRLRSLPKGTAGKGHFHNMPEIASRKRERMVCVRYRDMRWVATTAKAPELSDWQKLCLEARQLVSYHKQAGNISYTH